MEIANRSDKQILILARYERNERSDTVASIERDALVVRRRVDVCRHIITADVSRGLAQAVELTPSAHRLSGVEVTYIDAVA